MQDLKKDVVDLNKELFVLEEELLFPANSQTGETSALPVIWQQKADFDAKAMKLAQDAKTGVTRVTNPATLQAELQAIGQNCGGCHQVYRKPQPQ